MIAWNKFSKFSFYLWGWGGVLLKLIRYFMYYILVNFFRKLDTTFTNNESCLRHVSTPKHTKKVSRLAPGRQYTMLCVLQKHSPHRVPPSSASWRELTTWRPRKRSSTSTFPPPSSENWARDTWSMPRIREKVKTASNLMRKGWNLWRKWPQPQSQVQTKVQCQESRKEIQSF